MRKLALFGAAFSLAVFAANQMPYWVLPWLGLFCFLLFAGCLFLRHLAGRRGSAAEAKGLHCLQGALLASGVAVGLLWMWGYSMIFYAPAERLIGTTETVSATVLNYAESTDYGFKALVRIDAGGTGIKTLLYGDSLKTSLEPGDELTLTAGFLSAKESHGDAVSWYTAKGIFLIAHQTGELAVQKPEQMPFWTLPAVTMQKMQNSISKLFSGECGALVLAVVTGNLDGLTDRCLHLLSLPYRTDPHGFGIGNAHFLPGGSADSTAGAASKTDGACLHSGDSLFHGGGWEHPLRDAVGLYADIAAAGTAHSEGIRPVHRTFLCSDADSAGKPFFGKSCGTTALFCLGSRNSVVLRPDL